MKGSQSRKHRDDNFYKEIEINIKEYKRERYCNKIGRLYIANREIVAQCDCKSKQNVNRHETRAHNDQCIFCEHYVFWGPLEHGSLTFEEIKYVAIKETSKDRDKYKKISKNVKEGLFLEYVQGKSATEIARENNISTNTVHGWTRQWRKEGRL